MIHTDGKRTIADNTAREATRKARDAEYSADNARLRDEPTAVDPAEMSRYDYISDEEN